jgi:hypothetical protein
MYVILAISLVALALLFVMKGSDGAWGGASGNVAEFDGLDVILIWAYILLGFSVLTAIVMSILNMGKNQGGGKSGLYVVIILAVSLIVSYFLASPDPVITGGGKNVYDNKLGLVVTDMGLYTAYFTMLAAAVVVVLGGIVSNLRK